MLRSVLTHQYSQENSCFVIGFDFSKQHHLLYKIKMVNLDISSAVFLFDFYFFIYIRAVSIWVFIISFMLTYLSKIMPQVSLIYARKSLKNNYMLFNYYKHWYILIMGYVLNNHYWPYLYLILLLHDLKGDGGFLR